MFVRAAAITGRGGGLLITIQVRDRFHPCHCRRFACCCAYYQCVNAFRSGTLSNARSAKSMPLSLNGSLKLFRRALKYHTDTLFFSCGVHRSKKPFADRKLSLSTAPPARAHPCCGSGTRICSHIPGLRETPGVTPYALRVLSRRVCGRYASS